jgi:protein O-GlcNAc transferase
LTATLDERLTQNSVLPPTTASGVPCGGRSYRAGEPPAEKDCLVPARAVDWATAGCAPSFNLAHHDRNNRVLKRKFAAVFEPFFPTMCEIGTGFYRPDRTVSHVGGLAPGLAASCPSVSPITEARVIAPCDSRPPEGGTARAAITVVARSSVRRPRVGFVVTRGHEGVFLRCLGGIIQRLGRAAVEPWVFCSRTGAEKIRQGLGCEGTPLVAFSDRFTDAVACLRDARCDVLYHWEVGTDTMNYFLPFARLAPVQCTSWGTQVTSGVPAVDYYLSSPLIEGDDRDDAPGTDRHGPERSPVRVPSDHYTETLWWMTTLPTFQRRESVGPGANRDYFSLPADRHLYVCPHSLVKFHPAYDQMYGNVLRYDGDGLLVLKEGRSPEAGRLLRARFARTLADVADRIVWLPFLSRDDYFRLVAVADVVLDALPFGAGTTAYDVFSLEQPLVTLPGEYNVGRYTLACYRRMGLPDLIAESPDQYVQLAVRVGTDREFRQFVRMRIAERSEVLFDDQVAVDEHVRFFSEAVRQTA